MNNYKNLVPIALIAFALLGCYSRISEAQGLEKEYNQYLADAREYRSGKIYVDAQTSYQSALNMRNTMELCQEVGDMFLEYGKGNLIEDWGEYMIETYPKRIEGYEYIIDYLLSIEDYEECFSYYDIVEKRALNSETLTAKMNRIKYEYDIEFSGYENVQEYSFDYAVAYKEGMYGYLNKSGNNKGKIAYLYAGPFNAELAPVQDQNGEFYFIDVDGNRKKNYASDVDVIVTRLGYIGNSTYLIGNDEKIYYADIETGAVILGPFEDGTSFTYEIAGVKENGKWHLMNKQGETLSGDYLGFIQDVKGAIYRNETAFAQTDTGVIGINKEGKQIGKNVYEDAKCFLDSTYAAVKINGMWGFVDGQGKIVIEPQYEDAKSFLNGFAAVKKNGLWGYINQDGELVIAPAFEDANSMSEKGRAFVKIVNKDEWKLLSLTQYNH